MAALDCLAATAAAARHWDRELSRPACRLVASARRHWELAAAAPAPGSRPAPRLLPRRRQRSGTGATPSPRRRVRPLVPSPRKLPNQPTSGASAPNGSRPAAGWRPRVNGLKTDMVNGRLSLFTLPCQGEGIGGLRPPFESTPTLRVGYGEAPGWGSVTRTAPSGSLRGPT